MPVLSRRTAAEKSSLRRPLRGAFDPTRGGRSPLVLPWGEVCCANARITRPAPSRLHPASRGIPAGAGPFPTKRAALQGPRGGLDILGRNQWPRPPSLAALRQFTLSALRRGLLRKRSDYSACAISPTSSKPGNPCWRRAVPHKACRFAGTPWRIGHPRAE